MPNQLGDDLVKSGALTAEQLKTAEEYVKSMGVSLGAAVVKLGFVGDVKLTKILAKSYDMAIADLQSRVLPVALFKKIPWQLIKKHHVVPLQHVNRTLTVATADPTDYELIEELQFATGLQVELNIAPRSHIAKAIEEAQQELAIRSEPKISAKEVRGSSKLRPASQATLEALSDTGEAALVDEARTRGEGKFANAQMSRAELREAMIPALIKKGVISKTELFDAVGQVLISKGVLSEKDLKEFSA